MDLASWLDIKNFTEHSILNDAKVSNGVLRLNRFVAVLDIPKSLKGDGRKEGFGKGNNQDVWNLDGGEDFLSWNCFKINCPAFKLEVETKELNMIPRHYVKNWTFDELEVSYLESSDMKIRHFFFEWLHAMLDVNTFQRRFYDDVKSNYFVIYPLNFKGTNERYDLFEDLIPTDINSVNFDVSDDGNTTVLTTVKFKYMRHSVLTY